MSGATILQIVPRMPGTYDGVGDYALRLAKALQRDHSIQSVFAVAGEAPVSETDGFALFSGLPDASARWPSFEHVVLHYANYGYHSKGVPFRLRDCARKLRRRLRGRWITMFHELYASGPPWRSAFWVRPWQISIARDMIDLSDVCFVSNEAIAREILEHDPASQLRLVPVMSNFGEPALGATGGRSARQWAICGGAAILSRSLETFARRFSSIPPEFAPEKLQVLGGWRNAEVQDQVAALSRQVPGLQCQYRPEIPAEEASEVLAKSAFGWLDYFGSGRVWPGMIFKSGSFAAFCAHGTIPVLAHEETSLAVERDALPGPFYVANGGVRLPSLDQMARAPAEIHSWYHRHASSSQTAAEYATVLR